MAKRNVQKTLIKSIRLKYELAQEVAKFAHKHNRNFSNAIESILIDFFEKEKKDK